MSALKERAAKVAWEFYVERGWYLPGVDEDSTMDENINDLADCIARFAATVAAEELERAVQGRQDALAVLVRARADELRKSGQ